MLSTGHAGIGDHVENTIIGQNCCSSRRWLLMCGLRNMITLFRNAVFRWCRVAYPRPAVQAPAARRSEWTRSYVPAAKKEM